MPKSRAPFGNCFIHFLTDDGVVVGEPDAQQPGKNRLLCGSRTVKRGKKALEFFEGGQVRIMDDGEERILVL